LRGSINCGRRVFGVFHSEIEKKKPPPNDGAKGDDGAHGDTQSRPHLFTFAGQHVRIGGGGVPFSQQCSTKRLFGERILLGKQCICQAHVL
jgi:hypothetical protein